MDTNLHPRSPATPSQSASVIRTFLIADIRGYTRFSEAHGDEAAARLAERFVSIARERVETHSGAIVEVRGDEILAAFDSARQAIRAAVDLQEAITAEQIVDMPLGVGIGIDAGEAVPLGGGYRGRPLNMAARLCARARPGEILITAELAHLSGTVEGLRFEDRGPVRLKGISRPIAVITVTRPSAPGEPVATGETIAGQLEFRLLGPLEVTEDARPVPLGGPRQRLVLAHLLLAANRVFPMEELVDRVWDGEPPQAARNTIQSYVSRLRGALGADRIEGRAAGYVLHAEKEELDVLRFEELLRRARRQLPIEPREAVAALGEALELCHGSPLSDLADAPSLAGEIARLEELRLTAVEDLLGARLSLGEHSEALPELERLTVEHPLRERLWAHLMLARYRSGRQADALEAYRKAQELLAEELGIDPSPELQELHRRILQQDPTLQLTGHPLRGYRLLERVGEGAFGVVWRALDPELGREVAVKQVHPQLADDPSFVRRFEREAQTIGRLEHPHVVPLYDYWRDGSGAYLVMRWMRGGSLQDLLAHGPLDPEGAVHIVDQVASALSAAHRVHTVHRDVKPANVLLDEDGNAYLSDFGIAEDLRDWRDNVPPGSLGYHSPEQLRGEEVTPRSDIYGLGMLVQDLLDHRRDLPREVAEVITRATADDPEARHRDGRDLAVALRDALGLSTRRPSIRPGVEARNPYKGLLAFTEADADDFFGRDALVDKMVARLAEGVEGSRFLAVVGPSGSGKSSVVRAGLVPTLRRGALPGSDGWFYVEMLPGTHPMEELEAALLRIAVNPPRSLLESLERDEEGLARMVRGLLPDGTELVLVVDQLEEAFTIVDDEHARDHFLNSLVAAVRDPAARLRVVTTLRADFYDRPLSHPELAELMRRRSETVVPLTPEELERAIVGPADRVGVIPELALVAEMVADVSDRPGGLPLLEYALTELFDRRRDGVLTLEAYREIDGISGALVRRAEELFQGLSQLERQAAKQLFLRLVTPGEGLADTRRLVPRGELMSLSVDRVAMEHVIDAFGRHRMLSFDRDPTTRGPTVEVAHEALLGSWERLRIWIDDARDDLRQHRRLATAAMDWETSARDLGLLLRGSRLEQLQAWSTSSDLALSKGEQEYLAASVRQRDWELAKEEARAARERALERRSLRRLRALVAALTAAALIASGLTALAVSRTREAERRRDEAMIAGLTGGALSNLETDPELSLRLALYAVNESVSFGEPVPAETVEALHWALQGAGVEYPIKDGKTAVVAGPAGRRGVFLLPVSELGELGLEHSERALTPDECDRFFGSTACPALPRRFPISIPSESVRALARPPGTPPLAGTEVTLYTTNPSFLIDAFRDELDRFGARTGIQVRLVCLLPEVGGCFEESLAAGDPPDLAYLPHPGDVVAYARDGRLMDLGTYLDVEQLRNDESPYLVSLGTVGSDGSWPSVTGGTYGAFVDLSVKSLIWYPVPEFRAAEYAIPDTWAELIDLSDRLVADGRVPWCLGFRSFNSDGWPGTDWIENLVLAGAGPEVYDRWTFHELPFDSPVVREAFQRLGWILFTKGYLAEGATHTYFDAAQFPMVEQDPPGCWLHQTAGFAAQFFPPESLGSETDVFPFPAITGGGPRTVLGGGSMMAAFADRPEVREVVRFLLSPRHGAHFAGFGGIMSSNRRLDLKNYPPFWRGQARLLDAALASDTFRFDASDLMPPSIGRGLFWNAMMTYLTKGPGSLDRILHDLDTAWPDQG